MFQRNDIPVLTSYLASDKSKLFLFHCKNDNAMAMSTNQPTDTWIKIMISLLFGIITFFGAGRYAGAVTLDTSGTKPYTCVIERQGKITENRYNTSIDGAQAKCTVHSETPLEIQGFKVKQFYLQIDAYYEYFETSRNTFERVVVILDPDNVGSGGPWGSSAVVNGVYLCNDNPYRKNSAQCTTIGISAEGLDNMLPNSVPVSRELMQLIIKNNVGTSQQSLTGNNEPDTIDDFNPYGSPVEGANVKTVLPLEWQTLALNASHRLIFQPRENLVPDELQIEFQTGELLEIKGDLALPGGKPYPTNWKPLSGRFLVRDWSELDDLGAGRRGYSLKTGGSSNFSEGAYRVRVRTKINNSWQDWEPWRNFWVDQISMNPAPGGNPGLIGKKGSIPDKQMADTKLLVGTSTQAQTIKNSNKPETAKSALKTDSRRLKTQASIQKALINKLEIRVVEAPKRIEPGQKNIPVVFNIKNGSDQNIDNLILRFQLKTPKGNVINLRNPLRQPSVSAGGQVSYTYRFDNPSDQVGTFVELQARLLSRTNLSRPLALFAHRFQLSQPRIKRTVASPTRQKLSTSVQAGQKALVDSSAVKNSAPIQTQSVEPIQKKQSSQPLSTAPQQKLLSQ